MKFSIILSYSVAAALLPGALAWPGMSKTMGDLSRKLAVRQDDEDENDSDEMIGDLVSPGPITPVGQSISRIIVGDEDGFSDQAYIGKLPGKNTKACAADTCCIWSYIASDLTDKFTGKSGRCNGWARAAIRQGFHDAGAWSKDYDHGGADGSLILAGEISRAENHGLEDIISWTQTLYNKYSKYGIGMADLIQFMANTATVTCPLGPRVRTYIGRIDNSNPAPNGLLPSVHADADSLIELFEDKTIKSNGLAALVGAHTSSQQQFVDASQAYAPQDSTPGVWDVLFYNQTIAPDGTIPKRVFKFPSDVALAAHPQVADEWANFGANQTDWNVYFSREYVRLSLLNVNVINNLTECTKVLPPAKKSWTQPDKPGMKKWLDMAKNTDKLGKYLDAGGTLSNSLLQQAGVSTS